MLKLVRHPSDGGSSELDARVAAAHLPGLSAHAARLRFVRELQRSERQIGAVRRLGTSPRSTATIVSSESWSPLLAIVQCGLAGDLNEAIWLSYLTTFFGPDERRGRDTWKATRLLYGGFGEGRIEWSRVVTDATFLPRLCKRHADTFAGLPRGNHRKSEPRLDVEHWRGLLSSAASLVELAEAHGGLHTWFGGEDRTAEERFDRLMHELAPLVSFGRTGRFDLLALLGNLGIYELKPPRLYLEGSTGPLRGARRLIPGPRSIRGLDDELTVFAHRLGVEVQVMEDALCNWQKR